ncbi:MAG: hypothetical protein HYR76_05675 [Ignavibacteria bacterium]|nr:hypothetical protein [Ignavibacteria bacterium]
MVRFAHLANGVDTIAFQSSIDPDTLFLTYHVESTIINGPDTILARDTARVTIYPKIYYRRFRVDFTSPLEVIRDGASDGIINFQGATPYRDVPAGDRKISLMSDCQLVDTLVVQQTDSVVVSHRDTVGRGSLKSEDTYSYKNYWHKYPSSTTVERIVADFKNPKLVVNTDQKATVYLLHDTKAILSSDDGQVLYGVINYFVAYEHYTFAPSPNADSIGIRFLNGSRSTGGIKDSIVAKYQRPDNGHDTTVTFSKDNQNFATLTVGSATDNYYRFYRGTFTIYAYQGGTTNPIDSLTNLDLAGAHRFTFAIVDSGSTVHLKKYDDD